MDALEEVLAGGEVEKITVFYVIANRFVQPSARKVNQRGCGIRGWRGGGGTIGGADGALLALAVRFFRLLKNESV
jgi:hypothetical protein